MSLRAQASFILFIIALACAALFAAEADKTDAEKLLDDARASMLSRNYAAAAEALGKYIALPDAKKDDGLLLAARALSLGGKAEAAIQALDRLAAECPKSRLLHKAALLKAELLVGAGKTADALKIFDEQAKRVTSEARRLEMAQVYLKFADAFFKPEDEVKKPDWAKADAFYAKAMDIGLPLDKEADVVLRRAEALAKLNRHPAARVILEAWKKKNPAHAKVAEVSLALGETYLAMGDRPGARRVFRDVQAVAQAENIAVKAAMGVARSFGLPQPESAVDLELGAKALLDVVSRYPGNETAPKAAFMAGSSYFNFGRYDEARARMEAFLASALAKPGVEEVPSAKVLLGMCHFLTKSYPKAVAVWRGFLADHPAHEMWTNVQRQIIDAEYQMGSDPFADKAFDEAKKAWDAFLANHPLDGRCPGILLMYGKADMERKKFEGAISQWEKLVSKYPRTDEASEGLFLTGKCCEEELGKYLDALKAYRKLDFGPYAGQAAERIAALERKELRVRTDRAFRTDEKPVLKVSVRNIEEVEFRTWFVDMESYFGRMHTADGVQNLDVALIEPGKTWKVKVDKYEAYREIERDFDMPVEGPGVWAVNVTGGDLEATTVLLRTDIALIIKGSRQNLLVFAQNMKTGAAQPGVKIIVSDGAKILLDSRTGADGALLAEPEGIAQAASLRVLGAFEGSCASNTLEVGSLPAARGLARRAYLFTDRPAYRPGDSVRLKAVLREVSKGAYTFEPGVKYGVSVTDSRGALIKVQEAQLTEFGTLDWTFNLPASAPLGQYRLAVTFPQQPPFTASFDVVEFKLPRIDLQVEIENMVCYRGEKVKGTVRAKTFYGEPAAGRRVEYGLGNLHRAEGTTGDKGEIAFEFDTREFGETQTVALWAQIPAEGVRSAANVHIATTSFKAEVATLRDVYLSDERFTVDVKTSDMAGKPVSIPLELGVFRLEASKGGVSEVPAGTFKVTTDAKEGRGSASMAFKKGGRHRVRAKGTDKFGNTVTAEREVFVSGADDEIKLRILSDREEYSVGEKPFIDVVCRIGQSLALLTFEGERIFRYEIAKLSPGTNPVPVSMDADLSPNFILSAAIMDGSKVHEAGREFRVNRKLSVTVRPLDQSASPGGTARVEIVTLDPTGKPASAEVALAMIDRAYLALFPRTLPDPADTFFTRREKGCGTVSSNTFSFDAVTSAVLSVLKEEERRLEEEGRLAEDAKSLDSLKERMGRLRAAGARPGAPPAGDAGAEENMESEKMVKDAEYEDAPADKAKAEGNGYSESRGIGGGAGGRKNLRAYGGGRPAKQPAYSELGGLMEGIRAGIVETGYWNPKVVTGEDGRAVVEIKMPDNVTTWELVAMGTTKSLLVGLGGGQLASKKELVVEIKAPGSMIEGDSAKIRGSVRNLSGSEKKISLTMSRTRGTATDAIGTRQVTVPAQGEAEVEFEFKADAAGETVISLQGEVSGKADAVREKVVIYPKGTEIRAGFGGTGTGNRKVNVALPEREFVSKSLTITVGASLSRSLMEIGAEPSFRDWCCRPAVVFSPADRGLLDIAKRRFLKATGRSGDGEWSVIEARISAAVDELAVSQDRDGGFGWSRKYSSSLFATAQAARFLALAREEGFTFDSGIIERSRQYLQHAFSANEDNTAKAAALRGMAHTGDAQFAYVNRLFRNREGLSNWALAVLALTLIRIDRPEMAAQVAALIENKADVDPPPEDLEKKVGAWQNRWADSDRAEETALMALALCLTMPDSPKTAACMDRLLSMKVGSAWPTGKATAAAAEALAAFLTKVKVAGDRYRLKVEVNGKEAGAFEMDASAGARSFEVKQDDLKPGLNAVSFAMEGAGRYEFRIEFSGITREPDDSQKNRYVWIEKTVMPQPMILNGSEIKPGFGCVDSDEKERWVNRLSTLPEGRFGMVELVFRAREGEGYLVMEDSLPGGAVILEDSIAGDFTHFELRAGRIVFFLREGQGYGSLRYRYWGVLPGEYAVPAPRAWSAIEPSRLSTGPSGSIKIIGQGQASPDPFKPTPDELYAMGRERFEAKDFEAASRNLTSLFDGFKLRAAEYGETARMLLFCAIELKKPQEIVRYFEILKERFAGVEIPLDKTLIIAAAYRDIGDKEVAQQVYEGILEASFLREANIAGDLEDQGRFLDSIAFMERLTEEYPDLPVIIAARFSLSQSVYRAASGGRPVDGLGKSALIARAALMLRSFLADHPGHRLSDAAGFSLCVACLDLKASKLAAALAERLVELHPKSVLLDEFHYLAALAHFQARDHDNALKHAEKVAFEKFPAPDGGVTDSDKHHLAVYIMGQIHHSKGDFDKAAEHYEKVKGIFADAAAALEQFRWKRLFLPEVTSFKSGETIEVPVTHRNVDGLSLLVYPVDLMKLYLMRKNLNNITAVNLAGIKPFHTADRKLDAGRQYSDATTKVELPIKAEGAYLVVAKAGGIEASGLVVLTDMSIEAQEDTGSGRIRVTVRNEKSKKFEEDAHVKVVGSESGEFVSGNSDLRGVFEAGGLIGEATVIVKKGTSYVFFRGAQLHQPAEAVRRRLSRGQPFQPAAQEAQAAQQLDLGDLERKQQVLEDELQSANQALQGESSGLLKKLMRNKQQGMTAGQAKRK